MCSNSPSASRLIQRLRLGISDPATTKTYNANNTIGQHPLFNHQMRNGYDGRAATRSIRVTVEKRLEQIFRIGQSPRDLPSVLDGVEESCHAAGLAVPTALEVRLVAEEMLTNFVKYAHVVGEPRVVELRFAVSSEAVRMEFRDAGPPFNPLDVPPPDLKRRPEERGIGGLGVHIVKSLVDEATYAREGSTNVVVLIKHVRSTV
jgi:anti-sigma regulatory factor (Ser/Thr protein kinase)